jgi:threonine dehydratase
LSRATESDLGAGTLSVDRIAAARRRLRGVAHVTPLLKSSLLDARYGVTLLLKAENLQRAGAFKFRGAYNLVSQLAEAGTVTGVVTASSGNHGQAVALAARMTGLKAHVVVPADASAAKVAAAEGYGATVERVGTVSEERLQRAQQLAEERDWAYVPPYDHPEVLAGQATVGAEILEQVPDVDVVLVPIGGGGLISGIATAIKSAKPDVRIIGVEPDGSAATYLSRQAGRRLAIPAGVSIADGLRTVVPGEITFPIIQDRVDDLVTVGDTAIADALRQILVYVKTLVEPSGAAAPAYVWAHPEQFAGQTAVAVLSGGNIAPEVLAHLLTG